jgi:alcohol dehydrogenase
MTMTSFQHVTPPLRLFAGADSLKNLGRELARLGSKRAVVFCGRTLSHDEKLMGLLREAAGERLAGVYAGVKAHSPVSAVEEAVAELKRLEGDAIIAVGGGSAVVSGRAAAILLAEGRHPRELCTTFDAKGAPSSPRLDAAKIPQIVVPTTPNTATVKAGTAVFDAEAGKRLAMFDPKTRVQSIFIHPDFLASSPRDLLLSACLDSFAFAIEGLLSKAGNPISDALLIHSVRLTANHLAAPDMLDEASVRSDLTMAAIMCGQGTDQTGGGVATVLGHAIGAAHHVENGIVKALVLPSVLRFNAEAAQAGLARLATALDVRGADPTALLEGTIDVLEPIFRSLGVPARLRDLGVPQEALQDVADHAMGDWFLRGSPRRVQNAAELMEVLEAAW